MAAATTRFQPNEVRRENAKKIAEYMASAANGARLSWLEIETATGVRMDSTGRAIVRSVLEKQRRPYLSLPGDGIELSSADNGMEIVDTATRRFVSAFRGSCDKLEQVSDRHVEEMRPESRAKLLERKALFASMDLSKRLAKKS